MDNLPDIVSAATAVLALFLSIVSYAKTRKVERQQYKLNAHELKKIEDEAKMMNTAVIELVLTINGNNKMIRVENKGLCLAENVRLTSLNPEVTILSMCKDTSFDLMAGGCQSFNIHIPSLDKPVCFKVTWTDGRGQREDFFNIIR